MKSPSLWDHAYLKVAANKGAMTPGIDGRRLTATRP
jgi:RNA-directed DNA polymerase